jgi:hypothetical protein
MDYFTELLDSYSKLKKRTFKLRFISEADKPKKKEGDTKKEFEATADETAAKEFYNSVDPERNPQNAQQAAATGQPYGYIKKDGKVTITGGPLGTGYTKASSSWEELKQIDPNNATKLINFFDQSSMDSEASEQDLEQETLRKLGGYFELYGKVKLTAKTLRDLEETKNIANNFCLINKSNVGTDQKLKTFCQRIDRYLNGVESMGLEYKLANAEAFSVTDSESGTTKKIPLSAGAVEQAVDSHKFLISFLTDPSPEKCQEVKSRIGTTKNKGLVLFGSESNEGVVIKQNTLQDMALQAIKNSCNLDRQDLSKVVGDGFSQKEKNAIKGTMFESIMAFSTRMGATFALPEGEAKKARKKAVKDFSKVIMEKRGVLESIFNDMDPDAARDLPSEFAYQIQEETLDMLSTLPRLREGLEREIGFTKGIVSFMGAEDIQETGKVVKTGGREDLEFVYSDKAKAEEKAEAIGSSVSEKDGKFTVGIGLKRLQKIKGAKFGEINSESRLHKMVLDEVDDANIESTFAATTNEMLFGKDISRQKSMHSYANTLEQEIIKSSNGFIKDKVYINSNGDIRSQNPESTLKSVANNITKMMDVASLSRAFRFARLKKDVQSCTGNCPAKDYLLKAALVCGSNARDMGQVIVGDSGESLVVKHNEIFKVLTKANKKGTLDFDFKHGGASVTITDTKTGISIRYGQEGTNAGTNRRETRSLVTVPASTLNNKKVLVDVSAGVNEGINLDAYLRGQLALLESLLKPGKGFIVE